jgi:hypothetical protein
LGQVFIHTGRVAGQVNPLAPVTVVLRAAGGAEKARAMTAADAAGRFEARLADGAGQAVASEAGDVVTLEVGTEEPAITVEPLSFDFAPGSGGVQGRAPAGRIVQLILRLADGRFYQLPREVAADGTFTFGAGDVPARATWRLEDVTDIRVVLPTPNGHQIIDQTADFEAPVGAPSGPRIFLPVSVRSARLGVATAAVAASPAGAAGPKPARDSLARSRRPDAWPQARWLGRSDLPLARPDARRWLEGGLLRARWTVPPVAR